MAYENLKSAIKQVIKQNGNKEITGPALQNTLLSIVNSIGKNATYAGIAYENTDPSNQDGVVFYLGSKGHYPKFNNKSIKTYIGILTNITGEWDNYNIYGIPDIAPLIHHRLTNTYNKDGACPMRNLPTLKAGKTYRIYAVAPNKDLVNFAESGLWLKYTDNSGEPNITFKTTAQFNAGFEVKFTPQKDGYLEYRVGQININKELEFKVWADDEGMNEFAETAYKQIEKTDISPIQRQIFTVADNEEAQFTNILLKKDIKYRITLKSDNLVNPKGMLRVTNDDSMQGINYKDVAILYPLQLNTGFAMEYRPVKDCRLMLLLHSANAGKNVEIKVFSSQIALSGADTSNIKFNLWKGKKAIALGDSHTANRGRWMPIICDNLEMENLVSLNNSVVSGDPNTLQSGYELCICPLLSQAYSLRDKAKDGEVDVIFIEEVHYGEGRISNFDTIDNSYPLKPTQMLSLGNFNMTRDEEKNNFDKNYQSLLSTISTSLREKRTTLKSSIKTVSRVITFRVINETLHAGNFVLNIDGHDFSTQIEEGMNLRDAVSAIFTWSFREYTNWKNVSKTDNSITIVYEGSSSDASINFSHSGNGTGLSCTLGEQSSASTNIYRYFASENVNDWLDKAKWVYYAGPWDNPYASFKGVVETLQENFPNAILVPFTMFDNAFNEGNYNPRFDMVDYRINRFPKMYKRVKVLLDVAEYYLIKGIDVLKLCGISPFNYLTFYKYSDVHPKATGYKRIAETLVKELL